MALHVEAATIASGWSKLLKILLEEGELTSPRGKQTREILNVSLEIQNGLSNIFVNSVRDVNYRFMIAEWLWIMGGLNDVNSLATYNSVMRRFSDDDLILSGAYGPRLMPQWDYIIKNLSNWDSRQAVATIWTASPQESRDIPCTISLQWLIRREKLHCTVNMRSSDIWLGLPYDFFTFSQLTNMVASKIGREVGSVTMNLASSHLYEMDCEAATSCMVHGTNESISSPPMPLFGFPGVADIREMLDRRTEEFYEANIMSGQSYWLNYAEALMVNKQKALEVLRGMSPSRAPQPA